MNNTVVNAAAAATSAGSAGAALHAGAAPGLAVAIALVPILMLVLRWVGVIVARELFARKTPSVRRDLLALATLEPLSNDRTPPRTGARRRGRASAASTPPGGVS